MATKVDFVIANEPGWTGSFTRHQDPKASFRNGSRIKKAKQGKRDATPLGNLGTVLGSVFVPQLGVAYFVEWDWKPKVAVLITEGRICRADARTSHEPTSQSSFH